MDPDVNQSQPVPQHQSQALLPDPSTTPVTGVECRRFWELFLVCGASLISGLMWMTYSTAQDIVEHMYPGWEDSSTILSTLALWGPVISIVGSPAMPLLTARFGLRIMVLSAIAANAAGTLLRLVTKQSPWALVFAHVSMMGAGWAGVVVFAIPGVVSQRWFAPSERHTATAAILSSNVAGAMLGFLAGVAVNDESDFTLLLWAQAGAGVFFLVLWFIGFFAFDSDLPKLPPSLSAAGTDLSQQMDLSTAWRDIKILLTNQDFMALACSMGVAMGSFTGWGAVCTPLLKPLGYSEDAANWIGFASQAGCVLGTLVGGKIADFCQVGLRGPKKVLIGTMCVSAALFFVFAIATTTDIAPVLHNEVPLCAIITLSSLCVMWSESVFYESGVEALFGQVSAGGIEAAAGAFIAAIFNSVCAFFLVLTSTGISNKALTWVPGVACLVAVCILLPFYTEPMRRSAKDGLVGAEEGLVTKPDAK